ncbi:MAG: isoprenylcysteine carboxylmethyltransferase family protein [Brachybacterium sp.]|nr:isoprenylcysteine carboxylmethyltransferase family protein [Brachybacterium sp.]
MTVASGVIAALVGAGAGCLLGASIRRFQREKTTVNPVTVGATSLVTAGPNSLTRNPMYVGMAGLLLAHAIARRSWHALIPATAFVLAIDRGQVPAEEAVLRERFGAAFDDYARRVPRWIDHRSLLRSSVRRAQ